MYKDVSLDQGFLRTDIVKAIGEEGFTAALSKGVLFQRGRYYTIPIPSLRDYMVREEERARENSPYKKKDSLKQKKVHTKKSKN